MVESTELLQFFAEGVDDLDTLVELGAAIFVALVLLVEYLLILLVQVCYLVLNLDHVSFAGMKLTDFIFEFLYEHILVFLTGDRVHDSGRAVFEVHRVVVGIDIDHGFRR